MRRQFGLFPVIALMIAVLAIGTVAGMAVGGAAGYWVGSGDGRIASTEAANVVAESSSQAAESSTVSGSIDELVAEVNPAVVTVENRQGDQVAGMGSGFIINDEGHVVTNNHVIDGAEILNVIYSDGTTVAATLVGADAFQDVAVLEIDGEVDVPATVEFGDSSSLQPGQRVIAIGSALGEFRNTVTDGILSATGRSLDTGQGFRLGNLVQHNAPINPGNSGGPLLDLDGKVVGMNTAVVRGGFGMPGAEGLGFAVAGDTVKEYVDEIIATGQIERPFLGVTFRPVAQPGAASGNESAVQPVLVMEVADDSPAAEAGIEQGQIIVAVDDTTLTSGSPFLNVLYEYEPGDTVTLTMQDTNGDQSEVQLTLGERPTP